MHNEFTIFPKNKSKKVQKRLWEVDMTEDSKHDSFIEEMNKRSRNRQINTKAGMDLFNLLNNNWGSSVWAPIWSGLIIQIEHEARSTLND